MRNIQELQRFRLYRNYVKELSEYDRELAKYTKNEIDEWARRYMYDPYSAWIDIVVRDDLVGFVIISSTDGDCHPDCDFYINQAYIRPEYRNHGYMTGIVKNFINNNPGKYGYDVIVGNKKADRFWQDLFEDMGGIRVPLTRIRDTDIEKNLNVYCYVTGKEADEIIEEEDDIYGDSTDEGESEIIEEGE